MSKIFMRKGKVYDSQGEIWMAQWLDALKEKRAVFSWEKPEDGLILTSGLLVKYDKEVKLKTKTNVVSKTKILLRGSVYTPDFIVTFAPSVLKILSQIGNGAGFRPDALFFSLDFPTFYIECKPGSFDQNNMERLFINNQKFVWEKHKIFVNLIDPVELFEKTFVPSESIPDFKYKRKTKDKNVGDWKFKTVPKSIDEFLNTVNL